MRACVGKVTRVVRMPEDGKPCFAWEDVVRWLKGVAPKRDQYAHVHDGALDLARSNGVVSVTSHVTFVSTDGGTQTVYCFDLVEPPVNSVATGEPQPGTRAFSLLTPNTVVAGDPLMASTGCAAPNDDAAVVVSHSTADPPGFYVRFL